MDFEKGDIGNSNANKKVIRKAQSFTEKVTDDRNAEKELRRNKSFTEQDFYRRKNLELEDKIIAEDVYNSSETEGKDIKDLIEADDYVRQQVRDDPNLRGLQTKAEQFREVYYFHLFQSKQCSSEAKSHFEKLKDAISEQFQDKKRPISQEISELELQRDGFSQRIRKLEEQRDGSSQRISELELQRDGSSQRISELKLQCEAFSKQRTITQPLEQLQKQLSQLDTNDAHLGTPEQMLTTLEEYKGIFTKAQSQLKEIDPNYSAFDERHLEKSIEDLRTWAKSIETFSDMIKEEKELREAADHVLNGKTPGDKLLEKYNSFTEMSSEDLKEEILDLEKEIAATDGNLSNCRKKFTEQADTITGCLEPLKDKAGALINDIGISKSKFKRMQNTTNSEIGQLEGDVSKTNLKIGQLEGDVSKINLEIGQLEGDVSKTNLKIGQLQEKVSQIETLESRFQKVTEQNTSSSPDFQTWGSLVEITQNEGIRTLLNNACQAYNAYDKQKLKISPAHKDLIDIESKVADRLHQLYMGEIPTHHRKEYEMSQMYRWQ